MATRKGRRGAGRAARPYVPALGGALAWPDASNTGYSGTLTASGNITATTGQLIENKKITGMIRVAVANVIIRNCWIDSEDSFPIDADGASNLLVEDTTVTGIAGANCCILDGGGAVGATYRRLDLSGTQDGIKLSARATMEDCWVHDLAPYNPVTDSHNDGVQWSVADGITMRHNTVICTPGGTSCILMGGGEARTRAINCLVENNYLDAAGAGYALYGPTAPDDGTNVTGGVSVNVQVINNVFTPTWGTGAATQWETGSGNVWSGNVRSDNGATIPAP